MNEIKKSSEAKNTAGPEPVEISATAEKRPWEAPAMEEVSEQVMAQPYIRFT